MPTLTSQIVYIALGSNLGDRLSHLRAAAHTLDTHPSLKLIGKSRIYETAPVGGPLGQGPFLNAVLQLETSLPPRPLLELLFAIERAQGRERQLRWGPRTLDLDLLLYGAEIIQEPDLIVPHPRLAERAFVLEPLTELAPNLKLPGQKQLLRDLLHQVDRAGVWVADLSF